MPRLARHAVAAAILAAATLAASANTLQNSITEQKQAEQNRSTLRDKLKDIQQSISATTREHNTAMQALGRTEARISELTRSLADLKQQQADIEQKLAANAAAQAVQQTAASKQKTQLAALLRHEYGAGREDRLKLLLSADNPNRINRELTYAGYLSQAQAALLASLQAQLKQLADLQAEHEAAKTALQQAISAQQRDAADLAKEQVSRTALLGSLAGKIADQQTQAADTARDEKELSSLITSLGKKIQEEQVAAAKAERLRQEQLKAERARLEAEKAKRIAAENAAAERLRQQKSARAASTASTAPDKPVFKEIPGDRPANDKGLTAAEENARPAPEKPATAPSGVPVTAYSGSGLEAFRGKLSLPVRGEITTKFGTSRGSGVASRGIFIKTDEGSPVVAIADGKVLYTDYLRGLGNMTIIDHGGQYLSIYANNQSNLKHPGDIVKRGETIAEAGSSGGNDQSGLYFEIRHDGRAIDPLLWVTSR